MQSSYSHQHHPQDPGQGRAEWLDGQPAPVVQREPRRPTHTRDTCTAGHALLQLHPWLKKRAANRHVCTKDGRHPGHVRRTTLACCVLHCLFYIKHVMSNKESKQCKITHSRTTEAHTTGEDGSGGGDADGARAGGDSDP